MGIFLKKAILSIKIDFLDIITNKEYKNFLVSLVFKKNAKNF